jgi:hypothetical protein
VPVEVNDVADVDVFLHERIWSESHDDAGCRLRYVFLVADDDEAELIASIEERDFWIDVFHD